MDWLIIAQLIIKLGLPAANLIWTKWQAKGEPTQKEWDELKALANQTPESMLTQALQNNGIDINSPKAQELLALVKG
jgi:hypothetical protein